jgi:hypothetical protein
MAFFLPVLTLEQWLREGSKLLRGIFFIKTEDQSIDLAVSTRLYQN